ncbi:hypothetical protein AF332_17580 [Sporosarcina globispora]|uniref:Beta-carotene 15,15'-monooxygenase n=1 Tax=Sporosarcina globispora TaxID=1459 RepID=A0A0M0GFB6_SPOGL|nr:hypothetical protein [Sporosarcina globispora]KON88443.1 hypothetical protein AF332_17580 [Sporosarcina globispora]
MTNVLNRPKWLWFCILASLILFSNYTLYRTSLFGPVPAGAVVGSLLDLLVVVPLLTYILILRKRYSLKYLGIVILAGYGAAYLIIPSSHLSQFSFLPNLLLYSEMVFIGFELYIAYKVLTKLPTLLKEYRRLNGINSLFLFIVKRAAEKHLPNNRIGSVLVTEFAMFNYALFSWKKNTSINQGESFTYHRNTSVNAVYIMLIHAIAIESIGLHYWLHSWNALVAYIVLIVNIYGVLYFLAEINATRLTPFVITDSHLLLQTGFSKSMYLPLDNVKEIKYYHGPEKFSKQEKNTLFDARVPDLIREKPMFEILLKEPEAYELMYGLKRKAGRIVLNVDEPERFFQEILNKTNQR